MNKLIEPEDVIAVIKSFMDINAGDEATEDLLLAVGAELLDVSSDTMNEMVLDSNKATATTVKVLGATLLSAHEVNTLLSKKERKYNYWWWLRSPSDYGYTAACVNIFGNIPSYGGYANCDMGCIRPALNIDLFGSGKKVGDVFVFGGKEFKIISETLAWMHKDDIGRSIFSTTAKMSGANIYKGSDAEEFVDAWFEDAKYTT